MSKVNIIFEKRYKTIVYTMVFFLLWAFFQFHITGFNNLFTNLLGGYFFLVLEALVMITVGVQFISHPSSFNTKYLTYAIVFLFAYVLLSFTPLLNGCGAYIKIFIFPVIISALFICLRVDLKVIILDKYIRIVSYILALSVVEYILYQVTGIGIILFNQNDYNGINYTQLLFNYIETDSLVPRFRSLTIEPGNIGTACGLLLFAASNSKRYRFQYIVFWISGIISFSLAFYALAAIHLISLRTKGIPFLALVAGALFILSIQFTDLYQVFIIGRLEDKSLEEIDNRSHVDIDNLLTNSWNDGTIWFGKGNYVYSGRYDGTFANGIRGHIYSYGIISVSWVIFVYLLIYLSEIRACRLRKGDLFSALLFLVAFFVSYYQREYIFMIDFVAPFVTMPYFIRYKSALQSHKVVEWLVINKQENNI